MHLARRVIFGAQVLLLGTSLCFGLEAKTFWTTPIADLFRKSKRARSVSVDDYKFSAESAQAGPEISQAELEAALFAARTRVEEFNFIRDEAKELGIRVWLFGGTAAAFGHYVKWDQQRIKGDLRYQERRFDYDFTNIFRANQDADLVADASCGQIETLQARLLKKYSHFKGSKPDWEIRSLRENCGEKAALLDNPDFLNQHTDSNSVGMIELSEARQSEKLIRDLHDWNKAYPSFFEDIRLGKLHFYLSDKHEETSRFKRGLNPPILAAIRYLIKAFQFELEISEADMKEICRIIRQTDFASDELGTGYLKSWLKRNAPKLIQNAVNIEYATQVLDDLGLRRQLRIWAEKKGEAEVSAWFSKEPLRSKQVGQGTGKTAKELNLSIVAHETSNYFAYESITRSHRGEPNVLISRKNGAGEAAAYGDGFYTRIGREGARGTKITIRFRLKPEAREGQDFHRAENTDYVVILNKRALDVIPESLNLGPYEYFELLFEGSIGQFDKGILYRLKRRVSNKILALSTEEFKELLKFIHETQKRHKAKDFAWVEAVLDVCRERGVDAHVFSEAVAQTIQAIPNIQQAYDWIKANKREIPSLLRLKPIQDLVLRMANYNELKEFFFELSQSREFIAVEDEEFALNILRTYVSRLEEVEILLKSSSQVAKAAHQHFFWVAHQHQRLSEAQIKESPRLDATIKPALDSYRTLVAEMFRQISDNLRSAVPAKVKAQALRNMKIWAYLTGEFLKISSHLTGQYPSPLPSLGIILARVEGDELSLESRESLKIIIQSTAAVNKLNFLNTSNLLTDYWAANFPEIFAWFLNSLPAAEALSLLEQASSKKLTERLPELMRAALLSQHSSVHEKAIEILLKDKSFQGPGYDSLRAALLSPDLTQRKEAAEKFDPTSCRENLRKFGTKI